MFRCSEEGLATFVFYTAAIALLCFLAFSGCATIGDNELVTELAVEAATAKVLHEHPEWRDKTLLITSAAAEAIDGQVVADLAGVESCVKERINWTELSPEEQALVNVLISEVLRDIEKAFSTQGVKEPAERMIKVKQVLEWVNRAAQR
jgi:hypothetical protein